MIFGLFIGFVIGAFFGIFTTALLVAGRLNDEEWE